jgi:hypothetical protein
LTDETRTCWPAIEELLEPPVALLEAAPGVVLVAPELDAGSRVPEISTLWPTCGVNSPLVPSSV